MGERRSNTQQSGRKPGQQPSAKATSAAHRTPSAKSGGAKQQARRKAKSGPTPKLSRGQIIVAAITCLALLGGTFALGWHFGVASTRHRGEVLLVNSSHRLAADYVPDELVNLYDQRHSFRLAGSEIYLTRECYEPMEEMFHAAEEADMNGYIITSGYRSYERQAEVYAENEPGKAQEPGASEHQTGLAFDVTVETAAGFESTPQYSWLQEHAHEYGFIQRYPANKANETGISYEPWHYRYVGQKIATQIWSEGITLEAYLGESK